MEFGVRCHHFTLGIQKRFEYIVFILLCGHLYTVRCPSVYPSSPQIYTPIQTSQHCTHTSSFRYDTKQHAWRQGYVTRITGQKITKQAHPPCHSPLPPPPQFIPPIPPPKKNSIPNPNMLLLFWPIVPRLRLPLFLWYILPMLPVQ